MSVYDYFKGECPHCHCQLCGELQTKVFIKRTFDAFQSFYPGDTMPNEPPSNIIAIGPTQCCKRIIFVGFYRTLLLNYFKTNSECENLIRQVTEKQKENKIKQKKK